MRNLTAIIETAEHNYSAYIKGLDGLVATGKGIDEIRQNLRQAIQTYIDTCDDVGVAVPPELKGDYELVFKMDVKSLLDVYSGIFTKSGLERLTGINQKQLWHYANGMSVPRRAQAQKLERALHRLGSELLAVRLVNP